MQSSFQGGPPGEPVLGRVVRGKGIGSGFKNVFAFGMWATRDPEERVSEVLGVWDRELLFAWVSGAGLEGAPQVGVYTNGDGSVG